jgi:hypothetical protein
MYPCELKLYRDSRMFGGQSRYYLAKTREKEMVIPDYLRRAVAFVCYRHKLGEMRFAGTCFFLGFVPEGRAADGSDGWFPYTITAKHVIIKVKNESNDGKAILRVNLTNGGVQNIDTNADDWLSNIDDSSNTDASDVLGAPSKGWL